MDDKKLFTAEPNVFVNSFVRQDYAKQPVTVCATNHPTNRHNYGGKFDKVNVGMYITKVIYSDPATIVFWSDDTKTISKVQEDDVYNKETGLALCILKKLVGSEQTAQLIKDWVVDGNFVDIKTIRNSYKKTAPVSEQPKEDKNEDVVATINHVNRRLRKH